MPAPVCDPKAPKKAVSLSINGDLLRQARELTINLSKTLESQLEQVLREELIGALPARILREPIANLADQRADIIGAIDIPITGI